ncbi:hypothetical protein HMP06_0334 [Sphingomonas sp. HMP6]|nr:hypothetical protein HMP06_0334 [Sphingomonas sp. HMP6]
MRDGSLGLLAHPAGQRGRVLILIARGIDHAKIEADQRRCPLAPITSHAGAIIDEREFFADETVEKGGFADVRPADNCDHGETGHAPP